MHFYWGGKNFINKKCLFYAKFFEFEVKTQASFFWGSIQPQHTVWGVPLLLIHRPWFVLFSRLRLHNQFGPVMSNNQVFQCSLLTKDQSRKLWPKSNRRCNQRSYQRWLDKRIYKTEMKFWAVGAEEKKNLPTAISKQLLGVVFSTFYGQKINLKFLKKYSSVRTKKLHNIKLRQL